MTLRKKKNIFNKIGELLRLSGKGFIDNSATKLGASLSFYTIFSLPPLLIIIISAAGVFFGPDAVKGELYGQINKLVGPAAAMQIQEAIKNVALSHDNALATTIGVISLLLGASGVFSEIQDSINMIWGIKAKPNRGLRKFILNRLVSFSMVVVMGFLLLVSLLINAIVDLFSQQFQKILPGITGMTFSIVNYLVLVSLITSLFVIIFRTLPDGKVALKDTIIGSLFTTTFFMFGKFAIGAYLGHSKIISTYGAAGSVILILLWVYYSSLILYFGAEFTKVYAFKYGKKIIPSDYAVFVEVNVEEVEA